MLWSNISRYSDLESCQIVGLDRREGSCDGGGKESWVGLSVWAGSIEGLA